MPVRGHIDRCDAQLIQGWIMWVHDPAKRIEVEVLFHGVVVAQGIADRYRMDVRDAGFGDGCSGFSIHTPPAIAALDLTQIVVRPKGVEAYLVQRRQRVEPPATPAPRQASASTVRFVPEPSEPRFWTDRDDWFDILCARHRSGTFTDEVADEVCRFKRDGVIVHRRAASSWLVEMAQRSLALAQTQPPQGLRIERQTSAGDFELLPAPAAPLSDTDVLVDPHAYSASVRSLQAAPAGIALLSALFGEMPLLFRSRAPAGLASSCTGRPQLKGSVLNCLLVLRASKAERGSVAYRLGSHGHGADGGGENSLPTRVLKAEPGSLVIWHPDLVWTREAEQPDDGDGQVVLSCFAPASAASRFSDEAFPSQESHGCRFVSKYHHIAALV